MTKPKHTYIYNILLSISIGLIIIYFLPDLFDKYNIELSTREKYPEESTLVIYSDLNVELTPFFSQTQISTVLDVSF